MNDGFIIGYASNEKGGSMSDAKSVVAINSFISRAKLKCKGELFKAQIEVFDTCGTRLCQTTAECKASDHTGFAETQFNIIYAFGDDIMKQLNLRGYYGTNWQCFSLDEDALVITDDDKDRVLVVKKI